MWNVRDEVIEELPRTNNSVEAWHSSSKQIQDCHHPSVYKLVEHFRKEQDYNELKIEMIRCGEKQPVASKAEYVKLNRRLQDLVPTYGTLILQDFLKGIANSIKLNHIFSAK